MVTLRWHAMLPPCICSDRAVPEQDSSDSKAPHPVWNVYAYLAWLQRLLAHDDIPAKNREREGKRKADIAEETAIYAIQ
ncbi:unnamed protein product [Fusarium venenatum]|uniref:Uncharacterized protein n=1 Tax=Fusarium venenatum TaxID=56646 RepID=A0A2L2TM55_9HYPO|nr:LOW QUALITY PROTEIN: uncharacterized protein FVRRES_04721 [Fusarium venenatum]CEI60285.1 unnamed protein product [Fusarium venenatum]